MSIHDKIYTKLELAREMMEKHIFIYTFNAGTGLYYVRCPECEKKSPEVNRKPDYRKIEHKKDCKIKEIFDER